jgi:hypothetical protein
MSLTEEDKQWIADLLSKRLHDMETRILAEFHKWASPFEARQRSHAGALRFDRVKKLGDE